MRVLPTKWRRKPAGIDMERNCVIVTLCVVAKPDEQIEIYRLHEVQFRVCPGNHVAY